MTADRISAYLDGGLTLQERKQFEEHLLICAECRRDLADASEWTPRETGRWILRGGVPAVLAAAAALVLWLGVPGSGRAPAAGPVLRGAATSVQLQVVAPAEGERVVPDSLMFRWRAAGPASSYVFTLTDENGDVLYTVNQSDTTLVLPRAVGLEMGGQYYWVVDALLDGARSASSGFQGFQVE